MQTYARWLFGIAAVFNIAIGLTLVFLRPLVQARLGIGPAEGVDLVLANMAGLLIAMVGVLYGMIGREPDRYRPMIIVGVLGKLGAVVLVTIPWLRGEIPATLPTLVAGDLVFAALFLDYLRRTRA